MTAVEALVDSFLGTALHAKHDEHPNDSHHTRYATSKSLYESSIIQAERPGECALRPDFFSDFAHEDHQSGATDEDDIRHGKNEDDPHHDLCLDRTRDRAACSESGPKRCCPRMPRCQRKGSQPQAPAEPEHQGEGREDQADLREFKHVLGVQGKKERACRDACRPQQRVLEGVEPRCAYVVCVQGAWLWREDWAHALSRGAVHRNTSR